MCKSTWDRKKIPQCHLKVANSKQRTCSSWPSQYCSFLQCPQSLTAHLLFCSGERKIFSLNFQPLSSCLKHFKNMLKSTMMKSATGSSGQLCLDCYHNKAKKQGNLEDNFICISSSWSIELLLTKWKISRWSTLQTSVDTPT